MDRRIVYPGQVPLTTDLLETNRFAMVALGKLIEAVFGSSNLLHGFACAPTTPASLSVEVAPGQILSLQNIDSTPYGALAADIAHQIVKQGLILEPSELACAAPATLGHSINYLVQIAFSESDTDPLLRTYYNADDPSEPWLGANNNGVADATRRKAQALVGVKAGVAAPTGSQSTPAPDTGYVGAYVVTVDYGQTEIVSGDIALYPNAPFLTETLGQKLSQTSGDGRYLLRSGGAMTGHITLPGNPANPLEAAPKQYVDGLAAGIQIKSEAMLATSANISLSGEQTVDGTLTSGSRVLVKNQTAAAENGIYITASGAWARAADMDAWSEVPGALVMVSGGSTQAGSAWLCSSPAGGSLGTTAVTFQSFFTTASFQAANAFLAALAALSEVGLVARTGAGATAARTIAAGAGILVGNGDGAAGNPAVALDKASAAQFRSGTANKALDAATPWAAAQSIELASSGAIAFDMAAAINGKSTLNGAIVMNAPLNVRDGQTGKIELKQDATGGRTATWNAAWKWAGGSAPALSTAPSARDIVFYVGLSDGTVLASMHKGV